MLIVRVHDWNPWSEMNRMMSSGRARRDERADRLVGLAEDVGHLLADARVLVLRVVGVVGRDVVADRQCCVRSMLTQTLAIRSHSVLSISHSLTLMRLAVTS